MNRRPQDTEREEYEHEGHDEARAHLVGGAVVLETGEHKQESADRSGENETELDERRDGQPTRLSEQGEDEDEHGKHEDENPQGCVEDEAPVRISKSATFTGRFAMRFHH